MVSWKTVAVVGMVSLTAGCLGSGGSGAGTGGGGTPGGGGGTPGGGGGGGSVQAFETAFTGTQQAPTQTALSGTVNYTGEVLIDQGLENQGDYILGDLDMDINFGAATDQVDGTADNFRGEVGGQAVTFTGTLNSNGTANTDGNSDFLRTTLPAPASGEITSLSTLFEGQLTDSINNETADVDLSLQGNFVGPNGSGAFGGAGGSIDPVGPGQSVIIGGRYYIRR